MIFYFPLDQARLPNGLQYKVVQVDVNLIIADIIKTYLLDTIDYHSYLERSHKNELYLCLICHL